MYVVVYIGQFVSRQLHHIIMPLHMYVQCMYMYVTAQVINVLKCMQIQA